MGVVRSMFPNITVPEPTDFYFPRWNSNPLFRGSYSNWPPSFFSQHLDNLRANVGRLYFAGEATSRRYFGAYMRCRYLITAYWPRMDDRFLARRLFWRIECWTNNSWVCQVRRLVLCRPRTFCSSHEYLSLRNIVMGCSDWTYHLDSENASSILTLHMKNNFERELCCESGSSGNVKCAYIRLPTSPIYRTCSINSEKLGVLCRCHNRQTPYSVFWVLDSFSAKPSSRDSFQIFRPSVGGTTWL